MLDKDKLRLVVQKIIDNDKSWLDEQMIDVKDKLNFYIVNYNIKGHSDYNWLTRGLVIQKPPFNFKGDPLSLIKSFPFTRFRNLGEPQASVVDLGRSEMIEKLDGCLVGTFFPTHNPADPHFHTRKMMSSNPPDMEVKTKGLHGGEFYLLKIIEPYVKQIKFTKADVDKTWVFEFIHEATFVWTKYQPHQYGLYLLMARDMNTFEELSEEELDAAAKHLGVHRTRRWPAIGEMELIQKMMKQIAAETPDFEGFVFREKRSGNRVKVKDPDYVRMHHLLDQLSFKNLVVKVLEGESNEVVAYFPLAKERVEKIQQKFDEFVDKVAKKAIYWRDQHLDRKSLALKIFGGEENDRFTASMIMKNFQQPDDRAIRQSIEDELRGIALGNPKKPGSGSPKRFLDFIGIGEEEEPVAEP